MKKKVLAYTVGVVVLVGIIIVLFLFAESMQPSARAKAERSQHDLTTLNIGQYRIEPFRRGDAWNDEVLLIHDWDGKYYVYLLPTENGKVVLPDRWWGWGYYRCSDFRPEVNPSGTIRKGGIIKCHDKSIQDLGVGNWEWSYSGVPRDEWGINMYSPPVEMVGGTLYINK